MAPHLNTRKFIARAAEYRLGFNADIVAITLALTFAALIRLNVIPHLGW